MTRFLDVLVGVVAVAGCVLIVGSNIEWVVFHPEWTSAQWLRRRWMVTYGGAALVIVALVAVNKRGHR